MTLIDAVARFYSRCIRQTSFGRRGFFCRGLLDCPHYTRPEVLEGLTVPSVLMSGHHEEIRKWRLKQSLQRTWLRRPELLEGLALTDEQRKLLKEAQAEYNS